MGAVIDAWARPATDVAADLGVDPSVGLIAAEAAARLERHGRNALDPAAEVPTWRKLLAQLQDPLVYLLIGAVIVSLVAWLLEGAEGVPFEVIVIAVIIVANAILGYVQEAKAEEAVAALQRMAATTTAVLRDGRQVRVTAEELVPGDVMLLAEGDAIAADGRLLEAATLMVAEASLTGESEAVLKDVDPVGADAGVGDRLDMVFSGTAVTRGRGVAVVTATGMETEIGNVARLLGQTEAESTPLQREVDRVGRMLGIAVILIAVVVIAAIMLTSNIDSASDVVDVLLVGVSLAVAAVPEGLPADPLGRARPRRAAHGPPPGDRQTAVVGGDARLGVGDLLGQDRHPDPQRDDDRTDRHPVGRAGGQRRRLRPRGRDRGGR